MKLIVGLGNPGKEYEHTRHNVGFICADLLQKKLGFPEFALQKKFDALISEGNYRAEKIIIAKPQTFMNASGNSVQKLLHFYRVKPADLFLIYDDVDLPFGKTRIRPQGSAGTHNGMKSVIEALGFQNFPRLRIGIESRGESAPKKQDITSFVLHPFLKEEKQAISKILEQAIEELLRYIFNF